MQAKTLFGSFVDGLERDVVDLPIRSGGVDEIAPRVALRLAATAADHGERTIDTTAMRKPFISMRTLATAFLSAGRRLRTLNGWI